jgi:hypothetical protein
MEDPRLLNFNSQADPDNPELMPRGSHAASGKCGRIPGGGCHDTHLRDAAGDRGLPWLGCTRGPGGGGAPAWRQGAAATEPGPPRCDHREEERQMTPRGRRRSVLVGLLVGMFALGFLCGSVSQRTADAQLQDIGKSALEKAKESGGALGSVSELGSSIVEMQQHVDGLQKNLDTLKKVQSSLTGGK